MLKRQAAFVGAKKMLKGALHCHTTRSDGKGDPAEVIRLHKENGYDFMALTDHRYYNYRNFSDAPITIVPGMEMDRNLPGPGVHCHHIVSIGPAREDGNGFEQDQRFPSARYDRPEQTQEMLDWLHENNNMTIYCHPEWSGTPAREFEMLRGNFAMEIWNSGCAIEDGVDTNAAYWDELLVQGQKIFGVATDDGHAMYQHCRGWVRVNSENNLNDILKALKEGAFYSSCGPEIYDFYVDKAEAHIECSPVKSIQFVHLRIPYRLVKPAEGEESVTGGVTKLRDASTPYIRAVVTDAEGRRAWTNPIFLDSDDFRTE
ncbi:MAG: CehA/McbA family metallohydrolase [Clostridia bacterium]|nr:CehA/McbA family metallohydrolase [Clostridia bacterium]